MIRPAFGSAGAGAFGLVAETAEGAADQAAYGTAEIADGAVEVAIEQVADGAADIAKRIAQQATEAAGAATCSAIEYTADGAAHRTHCIVERAAHGATHCTNRANRTIECAADGAADRTDRAVERTTDGSADCTNRANCTVECAADGAADRTSRAVECTTHSAADCTNRANGAIERAAHCSAHRTNRVAYGAIKHATHGATCRADNAAHQATHAQCAVLRCHSRLAGQLQIAVGHDFLAIGRLHAHFAGNTGIESCGDRTIMGLARQLLLCRQRDRRRRLDLPLTIDLVARQLQLRIHLAVNGRLEAGQRASGCASNSYGRLGTGIDRGRLGTGDANPGLRLRIRSHTERRMRGRRNVGRQ